MKEDYLWDKTGEDAEIERLENSLHAFRYQKNVAPALSAKVLPFRRKPSRKIFSFAMAAAACIVFAAFSLIIWVQVFNNRTVAGENPAETSVRQNNIAFPETAAVEKTNDSIVEKTQNSKISLERKVVKIRQTASAGIRQKETKRKVLDNTKPDARLTKEEQYAFNRLMLALSITSSKLKLVKDKVEGLEE